jgi:Fic family protein
VALKTVWGLAIVGALLVAATAINLAGGTDVYETLSRRLSSESESSTDDLDLRAIDATQVTDDAGRFSASALERVTGLSPVEFILLFVQANGGRVRQTTINRALPWSKSTVSRYLDLLESEGALVRLDGGRGNVVCLPDQVPDGYASE